MYSLETTSGMHIILYFMKKIKLRKIKMKV